VNPAWQIMPDPLTPDLTSAGQATADTGRSVETGASVGSGVTGRGILRPFRRDKKADFANGEGIALIQSAVGLVLGTICSSDTTQGELPWRTEFGSLLYLLRMRNNSPALAELAANRVAGPLKVWVPAVRVRRVRVTQDGDKARLGVGYDVTDPIGTKVLVSGLETSVPLG
jgi:phage baseplate assembly protein W